MKNIKDKFLARLTKRRLKDIKSEMRREKYKGSKKDYYESPNIKEKL